MKCTELEKVEPNTYVQLTAYIGLSYFSFSMNYSPCTTRIHRYTVRMNFFFSTATQFEDSIEANTIFYRIFFFIWFWCDFVSFLPYTNNFDVIFWNKKKTQNWYLNKIIEFKCAFAHFFYSLELWSWFVRKFKCRQCHVVHRWELARDCPHTQAQRWGCCWH